MRVQQVLERVGGVPGAGGAGGAGGAAWGAVGGPGVPGVVALAGGQEVRLRSGVGAAPREYCHYRPPTPHNPHTPHHTVLLLLHFPTRALTIPNIISIIWYLYICYKAVTDFNL